MRISVLDYVFILNSKSLQHKIKVKQLLLILQNTNNTPFFTIYLLSQFASQVLHRGRKQGTNDRTLMFSGRTDDTEDTDQSDNSVSPG